MALLLSPNNFFSTTNRSVATTAFFINGPNEMRIEMFNYPHRVINDKTLKYLQFLINGRILTEPMPIASLFETLQ